MSSQPVTPTINALQQVYDTWYRTGRPHWEDAPGKQVILNALRVCLPVEQPMNVIDIACGTGSFPARVRSEVSAQWMLHGIDFAPAAIEAAQQQYPGITFSCGDATQLDYPDGSFDAVTCYGSWEHFPDPAKAIAEAARVTRTGGWVMATLPTLGVHRFDETAEGWYPDLHENGHKEHQSQWNLTRDTWEKHFEAAGFQLADESLARRCGARRAGVFYFGVKLATNLPADSSTPDTTVRASFIALSQLAAQCAAQLAPEIARASSMIAVGLMGGGRVIASVSDSSAAISQHFTNAVAQIAPHQGSPLAEAASDMAVDGQAGDVLVAIWSGAADADDMLRRIEAAKAVGMTTIALTGGLGAEGLNDLCDVAICVPSGTISHIQEMHVAILNSLCEGIKRIISQ